MVRCSCAGSPTSRRKALGTGPTSCASSPLECTPAVPLSRPRGTRPVVSSLGSEVRPLPRCPSYCPDRVRPRGAGGERTRVVVGWGPVRPRPVAWHGRGEALAATRRRPALTAHRIVVAPVSGPARARNRDGGRGQRHQRASPGSPQRGALPPAHVATTSNACPRTRTRTRTRASCTPPGRHSGGGATRPAIAPRRGSSVSVVERTGRAREPVGAPPGCLADEVGRRQPNGQSTVARTELYRGDRPAQRQTHGRVPAPPPEARARPFP